MAATSSESDGATAPSTHHFPPEHISSSSSSSLHFLAPSPPAAIRRRRIRVLTGGIGIHQWPGKPVGNGSCDFHSLANSPFSLQQNKYSVVLFADAATGGGKNPYFHSSSANPPDTPTVLYIIGACQCAGEVGVSLCLRESVGRVSPEKSFLFPVSQGGEGRKRRKPPCKIAFSAPRS